MLFLYALDKENSSWEGTSSLVFVVPMEKICLSVFIGHLKCLNTFFTLQMHMTASMGSFGMLVLEINVCLICFSRAFQISFLSISPVSPLSS